MQAIVLGIVQGLTEFLPVSSSAHLYIVPKLLGWTYAGIGFDVALHWGTLVALLLAFGGTWWQLTRDAFAADRERRSAARSTWLKLAIATLPGAIAGLLLGDAAEMWLRSLPLQAAMLVVGGFLLWWTDRARPEVVDGTPGWRTSIVIGLSQMLALVPGVSRSGITLTAGRAMRLTRVEAARFSFLLATPITFGAGLLELRHIHPDLPASRILAGVAAAAIVGGLAIRGLLRWLQHAGFGAFFAYRALVAAIIVAYLVAGGASARTVAARHPVGEVAVQAVAQHDARAMQP